MLQFKIIFNRKTSWTHQDGRLNTACIRRGDRLAESPFTCNADMGPVEAREACRLDDGAMGLVQMAMKQFHLSARAFHRTLKLSRTIADVAGADTIASAHAAEALQYRARGLG